MKSIKSLLQRASRETVKSIKSLLQRASRETEITFRFNSNTPETELADNQVLLQEFY